MVKKRRYSPEFRAEAVKLVRSSGKPMTLIAKELGVPESSLSGWMKSAEQAERKDALTESEREELKRLRRDNERLQMERDFLKKAAAFFAKESK
jgi:transposase